MGTALGTRPTTAGPTRTGQCQKTGRPAYSDLGSSRPVRVGRWCSNRTELGVSGGGSPPGGVWGLHPQETLRARPARAVGEQTSLVSEWRTGEPTTTQRSRSRSWRIWSASCRSAEQQLLSRRIPGIARQPDAEQTEALVATYRAGSTVFDLAKQFGIDRRTAGKILARNGIKTRFVLTNEDIDRAVRLYERAAH